MNFFMSVSFLIAVALIARGQAVSIGSAEKSNEGTQSSLEASIDLADVIQDCLHSISIDDLIELSFESNMTRTAKCVMACVYKKLQLISEDNKLTSNNLAKWEELVASAYDSKNVSNEDQSGPILPKCTDDEILNKCSGVTDKDECEATYKIMMCIDKSCPDGMFEEESAR